VTPESTFDPATHTYRAGGRIVPSVTQVLDAAGLIDKSWYTSDAAQRGEYVAEATALFDHCRLDESSVDAAIAGYVEAWKRLRRELGSRVNIRHRERPITNARFGFGGKPDIEWVLDELAGVADIKTGGEEAWHGVQLAGYARLCGVRRRHNIYLRADGTYRIVARRDLDDLAVWDAALTLVNWRAKHERMNWHDSGIDAT
jgi:hypothetical protein